MDEISRIGGHDKFLDSLRWMTRLHLIRFHGVLAPNAGLGAHAAQHA